MLASKQLPPVPLLLLYHTAGQVIEGLDQAVMKMKEGERALVTVAAKHAFGDQVRSGNDEHLNSRFF